MKVLMTDAEGALRVDFIADLRHIAAGTLSIDYDEQPEDKDEMKEWQAYKDKVIEFAAFAVADGKDITLYGPSSHHDALRYLMSQADVLPEAPREDDDDEADENISEAYGMPVAEKVKSGLLKAAGKLFTLLGKSHGS